jgi:hypothetical protein
MMQTMKLVPMRVIQYSDEKRGKAYSVLRAITLAGIGYWLNSGEAAMATQRALKSADIRLTWLNLAQLSQHFG